MMQKRKSFIIGAIVLLLLIAAGVGYYMYSKPRQSAANKTAAVSLPAETIYKQYQDNEHAADQKYLGKVIEVQGNLLAVSHDNGMEVLSLSAANPAGGINCQMFTNGQIANIKVGNTITVKGKCTGFLMDVNLVDCIVK